MCKRCQEAEKIKRIYLIKAFDPNPEGYARPMIEARHPSTGQMEWSCYQVLREFGTKDEAMSYAQANGITDIEL
jgi:hypothetical protein